MRPTAPILASLFWELALAYEANWTILDTVYSLDGYPKVVKVVYDNARWHEKEFDLFPKGSYESIHSTPIFNQKNYQGKAIPGPEVRVKYGERVIIDVHNKLREAETSIHWHGLNMLQEAWADGVPGITGCAMLSESHTVLNFTIRQGPGTHWWHSHNFFQTSDGIFGAIIIEGSASHPDHVSQQFPYDFDHTATIGEWMHQSGLEWWLWSDSRTGFANNSVWNKWEYPTPRLETRPWVSMIAKINNYMIQGTGPSLETCHYYDFEDVMNSRYYGLKNTLQNYDYYPVHSAANSPPFQVSFGALEGWRPNLLRSPHLPSMFGTCRDNQPPMHFRCQLGGRVRFRVIAAGTFLNARFWIDRHPLKFVAVDGEEVVPLTNAGGIFLPLGGRVDAIIECNQDPTYLYYIYGQQGVKETSDRQFYGNDARYEPHTYAILDYGTGATKRRPPLIQPRNFTWVNTTDGATLSIGNIKQGFYPGFNIPPEVEIPQAIQNTLHSPPTVIAPPAQQRIFVTFGEATDVANFDHNNLHKRVGALVFVFTMQARRNWTAAGMFRDTPNGEPLLQAGLLGRSPFKTYGVESIDEIPFFQKLRYDPVNPITYEIVVFNSNVYDHPMHLHGFRMYVLFTAYPDQKAKFSCTDMTDKNTVGQICSSWDPGLISLPDLHLPYAAPIKRDTYLNSPDSYTVFRFTADNPGSWFLHCTIFAHMGFTGSKMAVVMSVEAIEGDNVYPVDPPPENMMTCGIPTSTYKRQWEIARQLKNAKRSVVNAAQATVINQIIEEDKDDKDKLYIIIVILGVCLWNSFVLSICLAAYIMYQRRRISQVESNRQGLDYDGDPKEESRPVWVPRSDV